MRSNVIFSIIYSSQDMEATWVSSDRCMDKEDVAFVYILHTHTHTHTHTHIQQNVTQPYKRMKSCHFWQCGWI